MAASSLLFRLQQWPMLIGVRGGRRLAELQSRKHMREAAAPTHVSRPSHVCAVPIVTWCRVLPSWWGNNAQAERCGSAACDSLSTAPMQQQKRRRQAARWKRDFVGGEEPQKY